MKKVILTVVISLITICLINGNAQTKVNPGIKLNGNLTNVQLSDIENSTSKFNAGVSVGGFVKISFNDYIALQPELIVNYTESKNKVNGENVKFKYAGVEIPAYILGQLNAGKGKVFAGAGPHIGYGFSADSRTELLPAGDPGENKIELDHWYTGVSTMAGYEFANKISVHCGYQLSFDFRKRGKSSDVNTQIISLGIGYRF